MATSLSRCPWGMQAELEQYHDTEWGVPCFDDRRQFEFLILEAAQAGLSWLTILKKREGYRQCFAEFAPEQVAAFTQADVERLMLTPEIVRNRKKIESTISNARCFLEIAARHGSFCAWFWRFTEGKPIVNHWETAQAVPAHTPLAQSMAKEMKRLGFSFLGPTVLYSHMQATGMVNDHLIGCFRHSQVQVAP